MPAIYSDIILPTSLKKVWVSAYCIKELHFKEFTDNPVSSAIYMKEHQQGKELICSSDNVIWLRKLIYMLYYDCKEAHSLPYTITDKVTIVHDKLSAVIDSSQLTILIDQIKMVINAMKNDDSIADKFVNYFKKECLCITLPERLIQCFIGDEPYYEEASRKLSG